MNEDAGVHSGAENEASEWLLALHGRTATLEEQARFVAWLDANPDNRRIYDSQREAWQMMGEMRHLLDEALGAQNPARLPRRFSPGVMALAAAVVLMLVGGVFQIVRCGWWTSPTSFETATAQVKEVSLADGTHVTLGASSRIEVALGKSERRVTLTRGEAYFDVTHDAARPFLVNAGATLVRVVGTKFDVNYGPKSVRVAVEEGRVEVMKAGGRTLLPESRQDADPHLLMPGDSALAEASGQVATINTLNPADLGAWRRGRFVYVNAPLRDVVADINRYYDGQIELADDSVGSLRLTSAFRADQIDRMLQVLEHALPVTATRTSGRHIVLSQRFPQP